MYIYFFLIIAIGPIVLDHQENKAFLDVFIRKVKEHKTNYQNRID